MSIENCVAVIGGGPAGLMAAEVIRGKGVEVHLYESMPSAGRKFLVAGKGGLNLTHSEPFDQFLASYRERKVEIEPWLRAFGPEEVRQWAQGLGVETFVGSSKRVFPVGMKSTPLLRAWIQRLREAGVVFHLRHTWKGWDGSGSLLFDTPAGIVSLKTKATLLALGGASWPITGSTGAWVPILEAGGIPVAKLKPSNCGFDVNWTEHFRSRFAGSPFKTVTASFTDARDRSFHKQGEFVITRTGVEGNLIYACSALLRDEVEAHGQAVLHLDLLPDFTAEQLAEKLARPRGSRSLSSFLEKTIGLKGVKAGLLWEFLRNPDSNDSGRSALSPRPPDSNDSSRLVSLLKDLPINLLSPRPIEEAISSAGGVKFEALDEHLMLKSMPGFFCAGEMLDWEAPTGGYLLTACFASGRVAGQGVLDWIGQNSWGFYTGIPHFTQMRIYFFPTPALIGLIILAGILIRLRLQKKGPAILLASTLMGIYILLLLDVVIFPIPIEIETSSLLTWKNVSFTLSRINLIPF